MNSGTVTSAPHGQVYAGIWTRFLAILIDGIILAVIGTIIRLPGSIVMVALGSTSSQPNLIAVIVSLVLSLVSFSVSIGYPIYFIGSKGQTWGKMIMKIKVIKADTGAIPGYTTAFLRETIGKILSSILLLGYITAFGDAKKQAWHDKIAGTVVVKV